MDILKLQNVKSFVNSDDIEIKPITILVGKNSSGKSAFMRFLSVLSQTSGSDSPLLLNGSQVDYGTYDDILHKRNNKAEKKEITFDVRYKVYADPSSENCEEKIRSIIKSIENKTDYTEEHTVTLTVSLSKSHNKIVVEKERLSLDNDVLLVLDRVRNANTNAYGVIMNWNYALDEPVYNRVSVIVEHITLDSYMPGTNSYDVSFTKKCCDGFDQFINQLDHPDAPGMTDSEYEKNINLMYDLLSSVVTRYQYEMHYLQYIGPYRLQAKRYYRDPEYSMDSVGIHGDNVSSILIDDIQNGGEQVQDVSSLLHDMLGVSLSVKNIGDGLYKLMIIDDYGNETNIKDTGYGISQVLPIATQTISMLKYVYKEKFDKIMCVEQPELHLHPAAQAKLAKLFEFAVHADKQMKFIIETHSEHLIRKLEVLIADPKSPITSDMVRVYYVDKNDDGEAYFREMRLSDNGMFDDEWPSGFFDEAYNLTLELHKNQRA